MNELEAKGLNGIITTDRGFVCIKRKGVQALILQGIKGEKRIPISNITAIQFKTPGAFHNGYIQFSILGGLEAQSGVLSAEFDENSVTFKGSQTKSFEAIREYIEANILARQSPGSGVVQIDPAHQLRELADLRDAGVITEEEFAKKKAEILERM